MKDAIGLPTFFPPIDIVFVYLNDFPTVMIHKAVYRVTTFIASPREALQVYKCYSEVMDSGGREL